MTIIDVVRATSFRLSPPPPPPPLQIQPSSRMAAARAEARKKAILARGTDRLNKLATSARGEDGSVFGNLQTTLFYSIIRLM